jgi:hypothetical protein
LAKAAHKLEGAVNYLAAPQAEQAAGDLEKHGAQRGFVGGAGDAGALFVFRLRLSARER